MSEYDSGWGNGYAAGMRDAEKYYKRQLNNLRERIEVLEWLREVEQLEKHPLVWHPYFHSNVFPYDEKKHNIFKIAMAEFGDILTAAKKAAEVTSND